MNTPKTLLIVIIFFSPFNLFSEITAGAALTVLDGIENTATNIIEDAENAGNNLLVTAAHQMITLIYNFKEVYREQLKETSKVLDQTQYNVFLNIQSVANKLINRADDLIVSLDNTIASFNGVIRNIPGFGNRPYISKPIIPVFIRNDSTRDEYELVFQGSNLDNARTKFRLNGSLIVPSEKSSNRHVYHVGAKDYLQALQKNRIHFDLVINYGGLPFLKRKAKYKYFSKVVPLEYGIIDVEVSVSNNDTIRISRVETLPATRTGASNWKGKRRTKRQTFRLSPTKPTNHIVVSSIKLKTIADRYGYGAHIADKSPAGILVQQHARSQGKPYGGGGKVQSRVSFTELEITERTGVHSISKIPMTFNDPIAIKLPNNTIAIQRIIVRLYDGKMLTLTTENLNENFEVQFRTIDKTLFIRNVVR